MTVPQVTIRWLTSSKSQGQGNCVRLAHTRRAVGDSKNPDGPVLDLPIDGLVAFAKKANTAH